MPDRRLRCADCGQDFTFTTGEQRFYEVKGFGNAPTRCVPCRNAHKTARVAHTRSGERGAPKAPEMLAIVCANCGAATQVLATAASTKPAYCADCHAARPAYR